MIIFFSILLLITLFSIVVYSLFHEKMSIIYLFFLTVFSITAIKMDWSTSFMGIPFLLIPVVFVKRIKYTQIFTFSMIGSILTAFFFLKFFMVNPISNLIVIAMSSIVLMCALAINGIFEDDLKKYLVYSNTIQTVFVLLDLAVAKLSGKISTLGTIQIFNYTFAGLLFFLTVGILSKNGKRKKISSLQGSYFRNKLNSISATIASISLAGVPGLNIFISEWLLFKTSFIISPVITIFGIFVALLLFIMYFKVVYVIMTGESKVKERTPIILTVLCIIFAIICLILGLMSGIQILLLKNVV